MKALTKQIDRLQTNMVLSTEGAEGSSIAGSRYVAESAVSGCFVAFTWSPFTSA